MDINSTITLNNGVQMPRFGLGVWKASPEETIGAVAAALNCGYRHIDTAWIYGNEEAVGDALQCSPVPRSEIFVTTKLWRDRHGDAKNAFEESLANLQLDFVDLYLSHFPAKDTRLQAYRDMESILASGRARAIGVSNYTVRHLEDLLNQTSIVPAVNQVEIHTFLQQPDLVSYCNDKGIVIEAYSPLAHAKRLDDPTLASIGAKYGKTVAQVMIRWCLEQDYIVIPKSVRAARIQENAAVFDFSLSAEDSHAIRELDEGYRTCWDPTDAP